MVSLKKLKISKIQKKLKMNFLKNPFLLVIGILLIIIIILIIYNYFNNKNIEMFYKGTKKTKSAAKAEAEEAAAALEEAEAAAEEAAAALEEAEQVAEEAAAALEEAEKVVAEKAKAAAATAKAAATTTTEKAAAEKAAKAAAAKAAAAKAAAAKAAAKAAETTTTTTTTTDPCFTGNTNILLENNTYKEISNIKRNDRIRLSNNKIGIVRTILKTEINSDTNICNIDGFDVTPNHLIYKIDNNQQKNNWILPKNITTPITQFIDHVYNLYIIMEDHTLPDAGFIVKGIQNNWAAMPCGHSIKYPSKNKSPFWKTHIVDILEQLEPEIDENGILLLSKNNFNMIKNVGNISYGIRYKNKLYGCDDNNLIIYNQ
jgi:cytoskeletal protein RodZ